MKLEIKNLINKKNILITGNTGFVGSWLSLTLNLLGANILGYSLKKKNKSFLSNLKKKLILFMPTLMKLINLVIN